MGGYHFKSADCGIVLEVTIMFADIVRAHGWSSTESRYFLSIYDLDEIARRHGLKVGQSRGAGVAVAGLPDPRNDHHVVMAL
jgi:hypothetical protein